MKGLRIWDSRIIGKGHFREAAPYKFAGNFYKEDEFNETFL